MGSGEDSWKRAEHNKTKILGRYRIPKGEEQRNNPPKLLQPDGTLATHDMCILERPIGEPPFHCMCHLCVAYAKDFRFKLCIFSESRFNCILLLHLDARKMTHTICGENSANKKVYWFAPPQRRPRTKLLN